ncbi:MAG TPA: Xaa-Pro peptidase family protein [Trueperaceae bacterium]
MDWIETAQAELRAQGLAGWLLYDFRGSNPVAKRFMGLGGLITRRVFLLVPARGTPTLLVHAIERRSLPDLPFEVVSYSSRSSLEAELAQLLPEGPVALEYSPRNDIPYLSFVDAGTVELLRDLGVEPVSSGDLLQVFSAWTNEQIAAHERAVAGVYRAKDEAISFISRRASDGASANESEVQRVITRVLQEAGLTFDHQAIVGFGPNSGDPHFVTPSQGGRRLQPGDPILLDIFAKEADGDAPYADITWMGSYGPPSAKFLELFEIVRDARDIGVRTMREAYEAGRRPSGSDVDRKVRGHIAGKGYGEYFIHRTGHSLGTRSTHGDAVHLDDFETRDTRKLLPGIAVTVEPGVYLPEFGVRSEIDVLLEEAGPRITTDPQRELTVIELS